MQKVQLTEHLSQQKVISRDWFLVGSTAGSVATIARGLLDYLLYVVGASDVRFPDIAGGAVLGMKNNRPRTVAEQSIGYVADAAFGGLFGASMALLLFNTPNRYRVVKGSLFGVGLWAATLSFGTMLRIDGLANPSPKSRAASFISTTLYGGLVGYLIDLIDCRTAATLHDQVTVNQDPGLSQNNILDTDVTRDGSNLRQAGALWND